jgi:TPR repeat protein
MRSRHLVALCVAAAAASPLHAQSVQAGIQAWQKADYPRAVAIWRPLAEKGDADAAFNLGQAYRLGRGVSMNLGAAQVWFERAARAGHMDAQTTLGLMLFQNGNQTGGLRWLKIAAERSDPRAMLVYGTALFNGDGVPREPLLGYAYVSKAADQGLNAAKATREDLDRILPASQRQQALGLALPSGKPPATPKKVAGKKASAAVPKPVATTPTPVTTASGAWRIQLGAFSQRGSAEALYRKLSGNSALAGRRPFYVAAGAVTRLQVGPFESKAAAAAACRALGQACFPVPAK